jgi:membrane-associated protease RseP (regulator of RpoE activity)
VESWRAAQVPLFWRGVRWAAEAVVCTAAVVIAWRSGAAGTVMVLTGVLASVALHEGGHLLAARCLGVKATEFFVGLGPTLWSRRDGEVTWGVKALPLGGFVRIIGMTSKEKVDPADEPRTFRVAAPWRRAVIAVAGPAVNLTLAIGLLFAFALYQEATPMDAARAANRTFDQTLDVSLTSLVKLPAAVPGMVRAAVDQQAAEPENRVLSPVGAARVASQAAADGAASALALLAIINVFLALFNLVPLPPLDGGHIAVAGVDALGSALTRRRVRVNAARLVPLTAAMIIGLAVLGLASATLDITRPIANPFS